MNNNEFLDNHTLDLDHIISSESESVNNVIKLLFSSLTVVFQKEEDKSTTNPIEGIPYGAARMLWNELLGGEVSFVQEDDEEEDDKEEGVKKEGDEKQHHLKMIVSNLQNVDKGLSRSCIEEFIRFMNDTERDDVSISTVAVERKGLLSKMFSWKKKNTLISKHNKNNSGKDDPFMAFVVDLLSTSKILDTYEMECDDDRNMCSSDSDYDITDNNLLISGDRSDNGGSSIRESLRGLKRFEMMFRSSTSLDTSGNNTKGFRSSNATSTFRSSKSLGKNPWNSTKYRNSKTLDKLKGTLRNSNNSGGSSSNYRKSNNSNNPFQGSFTGWLTGKKEVGTIKFLEIFQEEYVKYGVYLSGIMNDCNLVSSGIDASRLAPFALDQRKLDTSKRWNIAMANACRKQLVMKTILTETNASCGMRNNNNINKLKPLTHKLLPAEDDATKYAIKMYPSHLMRGCGCISEMYSLLMNPRFLQARLFTMNVTDVVIRHKKDVDALVDRLDNESTTNMAAKVLSNYDIFLDSFLLLVKCIKEKYPITKLSKKVSYIRNETNTGEIGKVLQLIATYIDEEKASCTNEERKKKKNYNAYSSNVIKIYKHVLDYFIASYGKDNEDVVGTTHSELGKKYSNNEQYDKAIDAYKESVRISWSQKRKKNFKLLVLNLNALAYNYNMADQYEKSIDTYNESLAIQKVHFGTKDIQVAETLNNIALIYDKKMGGGNDDDYDTNANRLALKYYTESLSILSSGEDEEKNPFTADIYFNRGLIYKKRGDYKLAIQDLQEALRIFQTIFGDDDNENVTKVLQLIDSTTKEAEENEMSSSEGSSILQKEKSNEKKKKMKEKKLMKYISKLSRDISTSKEQKKRRVDTLPRNKYKKKLNYTSLRRRQSDDTKDSDYSSTNNDNTTKKKSSRVIRVKTIG